MPSTDRASAGPRPVVRGVAWAGALSLAVVLVVYAAAEAVVDPAFVEECLTRGLSGRLPGASVEVGAVRPLPHRMGLSVRALAVATPDPSGADGGAGRALLVPRLTVTGIGGSALLGGTGLHLGRVRVTGATVDVARLAGGSYLAGVANGVDLELRELSLTGDRRADLASLLASLSRLDVPSYRARSPDGGSLFRVRGLEADVPSGTARLDAMRMLTTDPAVPPAFRTGGDDTARDTTAVALSGIAARGFAVSETGAGRPYLRARSVEIESFRVTAADGVVPDTSPERGRPLTPVQRLRRFAGPPGRIDTLRFAGGRVRYTERRVGYPGAGTIVFDRIEGSVRPFPFGPAPGSTGTGNRGERSDDASAPVRLGVRGRVAGSAPLWLTMSFPDRRRGLHFDAVGKVGALDLRELSTIFRPTEGIDIEGGRLDSLRFRMRASGGRARGEVAPVYRGLAISLEDPRAGGTGLDEHFRSFVLGLKLNARNDPAEGDAFRTGSLEYESSPGQTFPAFFWQALLTGLRDVAGV